MEVVVGGEVVEVVVGEVVGEGVEVVGGEIVEVVGGDAVVGTPQQCCGSPQGGYSPPVGGEELNLFCVRAPPLFGWGLPNKLCGSPQEGSHSPLGEELTFCVRAPPLFMGGGSPANTVRAPIPGRELTFNL